METKSKMNNIKNLYMIVATVLVIALMVNTCTQQPCGADGEVISSTVNIDSVRTHYEQYTDSTINWVHHSYSEVPELDEEEYHDVYFPPARDNAPGIDLSDTSVFYNDVDTFYYGKKDSSLHYNIRVIGEVRPVRVEMEYDIKELSIRDSVYVRDSINIKQVDKVRVNQIYVGAESIVYPGFRGAFLGMDIVSKKGWQFEVSGGVAQFNNDSELMVKVGIKKLISVRK